MSFPKISFGKYISIKIEKVEKECISAQWAFSIAKIDLISARLQCKSKIKPNFNRQ